jgi:hypothetical protein
VETHFVGLEGCKRSAIAAGASQLPLPSWTPRHGNANARCDHDVLSVVLLAPTRLAFIGPSLYLASVLNPLTLVVQYLPVAVCTCTAYSNSGLDCTRTFVAPSTVSPLVSVFSFVFRYVLPCHFLLFSYSISLQPTWPLDPSLFLGPCIHIDTSLFQTLTLYFESIFPLPTPSGVS